MLDPVAHHLLLRGKLRRVGEAEVVADRCPADVETESRGAGLQLREIFRRGFGKVVGGEFDRIEVEVGAEVDKLLELHRACLEVEVLAIAVRREAEFDARPAVAFDRVDGSTGAGEGEAGAGNGGRREELTTRRCGHGGDLRGRRLRFTGPRETQAGSETSISAAVRSRTRRAGNHLAWSCRSSIARRRHGTSARIDNPAETASTPRAAGCSSRRSAPELSAR